MTNIAEMQHLGFEKSHDDEEVIVSLNIHGAPTKARLSHKHAIIALGELVAALDVHIRREFAIPSLDPREIAHGHPGEPEPINSQLSTLNP